MTNKSKSNLTYILNLDSLNTSCNSKNMIAREGERIRDQYADKNKKNGAKEERKDD